MVDASASSRFRLDPWVLREQATAQVLIFSGSCALTIAATRAFLALSGYPQIGGSVFHLAHALWGGLLLIIATVLLIAIGNRWVPTVGALLGGVGAGLFVDEVGKFITQSNDYFFPLAASIVYLFLVALAAATLALSRYNRLSAGAHLHAALELSSDLVDGRVGRANRDRLLAHLDAAAQLSPTPVQEEMCRGLLAVVQRATVEGEAQRVPWAERLARRMGEDRLRRLTRVLLAFQALAGAFTLVAIVVSLFQPVGLVPEEISGVRVGGFAHVLTVIGIGTTAVAGVMSLIACVAMSPRRTRVRTAMRFGTIAMILLLVLANSLGAYASQFAVLADAAVQVITMGCLALWHQARQLAATPDQAAELDADPSISLTDPELPDEVTLQRG